MISIIIPNHNEPNIETIKGIIPTYFPLAQVIVVDDIDGNGKGWAIRQGLKKAVGEIIVFLDADMDIDPKMIKRLLPFLEDYDIVVGTKKIDKGLMSRRILTMLSRLYIRLMFGLRVDTQTGIKLYKREVLKDWVTNGYAFDIEILAKAKKEGYTMIEVPIDATITRKISFKVMFKTLLDTLKIKVSL